MKITIIASGHHLKTYNVESTAVPYKGDIVLISGKTFEVYERAFDFERHPGEILLLSKPKRVRSSHPPNRRVPVVGGSR